jgi:hypothetical protein
MDWASRFGSLNVTVMSMVIGVLITILVVVVALVCIAPWLHHRNAKEPQNASEWDEELPGGYRMFSNAEAGRSNEPIKLGDHRQSAPSRYPKIPLKIGHCHTGPSTCPTAATAAIASDR